MTEAATLSYPPELAHRLFLAAEVGRMARVSPVTVTRWAATDKLHGIKTPGGEWRFPLSSLLPFFPLEVILAGAAACDHPASPSSPLPAPFA